MSDGPPVLCSTLVDYDLNDSVCGPRPAGRGGRGGGRDLEASFGFNLGQSS